MAQIKIKAAAEVVLHAYRTAPHLSLVCGPKKVLPPLDLMVMLPFASDCHRRLGAFKRDRYGIVFQYNGVKQSAAIISATLANIRPVERLVPGRLQICQDTNADL
jgi:hypothetical protein